MPKRNRVQRPKDELKRELAEQLHLLRLSCEAFDRGIEAVGKHIALSIRVLIHQHGQSRALLDQLKAHPDYFLDSAGTLRTENLLTEFPLLSMQLSSAGNGRYVPTIAGGNLPEPMRPLRFPDWWGNPVLRDNKRRTFSRRDLVLHVADTDGGAHVDPELDQAYMEISRNNSLGWVLTKGDMTQALDGRPELACMRQIAHEILSTIHRYVPPYSVHSAPVIPIVKQ
ncbi:MAG TPA: hypothetical protein VJN64_16305 [Terriglobales bacterium]|nr:hypothetical protein [Terriglobales bacterium]